MSNWRSIKTDNILVTGETLNTTLRGNHSKLNEFEFLIRSQELDKNINGNN